jgi:hypothetical protein
MMAECSTGLSTVTWKKEHYFDDVSIRWLCAESWACLFLRNWVGLAGFMNSSNISTGLFCNVFCCREGEFCTKGG